MNKTVLVTGAAGFIGCEVALKLLARGDTVIGLDNLNDYYDVSLKQARLDRLTPKSGFTDVRASLEDKAAIDKVFQEHKPDRVVNLLRELPTPVIGRITDNAVLLDMRGATPIDSLLENLAKLP